MSAYLDVPREGTSVCRIAQRSLKRATVWPAVLALLLAGGGASANAAPTTASLRAKIVPIPVNPSAARGQTYAGTGNISGAGAAVEGDVEIQGDEYGGFPPPVTGFSLWAPAGVKLHPQGFPICAQAILESHEVANCPKRSELASDGSVSGVVSFGGTRVHETLTLQAFFAAGGRIAYYAEGTSPALIEVLGSGTFSYPGGGFGPEFSASVPLVATVPEAPYAVVQSIHVRVGAAYRQGSHLISYITLPRHCTRPGMPVRCEITFLSGPPVQIDTKLPCPAPH